MIGLSAKKTADVPLGNWVIGRAGVGGGLKI